MGGGAGMVLAIDEKFIFGKKMGIPLIINFKKLGVPLITKFVLLTTSAKKIGD